VAIPTVARKATAKPIESMADTDDVEPLIRQFVALGSGAKGEFETTAQFEARLKTAIQTDKQHAFFYDDQYGLDLKYDADNAVMKASVEVNRRKFNFDQDLLCIPIKTVRRLTESHVGQNSFGATGVFMSMIEDEFGVIISDEAASWLRSFSHPNDQDDVRCRKEMESGNDTWLAESCRERASLKKMSQQFPESSTFSFPLSVEQAQRLKPSLRIVLVGTIPDPRVYGRYDRNAATINDPVELRVNRLYVNLVLSEVRIVDTRMGTVVAHFLHQQ
jgi:hypothetical protein